MIAPRPHAYIQPVLRWADENVRELECREIGEHYGRYRLHLPEAERAMARSLERYGQLSPIVVCRRQERYELIDGFKRLAAARTLARLSHLSARLLEADERTAKAAIYGLNRAHAGVGGSLDHSGAGAGRRHEPGGSRRVVGTAQKLGVFEPFGLLTGRKQAKRFRLLFTFSSLDRFLLIGKVAQQLLVYLARLLVPKLLRRLAPGAHIEASGPNAGNCRPGIRVFRRSEGKTRRTCRHGPAWLYTQFLSFHSRIEPHSRVVRDYQETPVETRPQ